MSETHDEQTPASEHDPDEEKHDLAEVQERLDAEADGDGLAAEEGRAEEAGISEG